MAMASAMTQLAAFGAGVTDTPDSLPPSFWPTHVSKLGGETPTDLLAPGYGMPGDNKPSPFYHYPDAVFSNAITTQTREWLRACWTDADMVRQIVDSGADIHQANANGFTGLHMAASKLRFDIAEVLLEKGHNVNAEEVNGLTPLDYCLDGAARGEPGGLKAYHAMVELLESKGGYRKEERAWLQAANQEKYAPNLPAAAA